MSTFRLPKLLWGTKSALVDTCDDGPTYPSLIRQINTLFNACISVTKCIDFGEVVPTIPPVLQIVTNFELFENVLIEKKMIQRYIPKYVCSLIMCASTDFSTIQLFNREIGFIIF